jgi:hypothetical protein
MRWGIGALLKMGDQLDLESGGPAPSGGSRMRDAGLVGAGIVFGWLTSKTWSDPRCQLGLVVTAVMTLGFVLAVVGRGKHPGGAGGFEQGRSFLNEMRT